MSSDGAQLTFGELLERHGRINVPLIQRDYAHGRADQEEVREDFLAALYDTLVLPSDSENLPLNLDFIYGSVESTNLSCFRPLDGQQRLTTLFLLHWYLSWRDGESEAFQSHLRDGTFSRFGYQVRPSSEEFFNALINYSPSQDPQDVEKISDLLQDQSWYFISWRLDPTIQSALHMLDAIHNRFANEHGLYARLTDTKKPAITFWLLDLHKFDLSDDLYIKMNARGKPLTSFEAFKAQFEKLLDQEFPNETRPLDGQAVSVSEYFARRMDTRWSDFFWPYRDQQSHVFDDAVMKLFRAVILITRSPANDHFVEDVRTLCSSMEKNSFRFFQQHDWLDAEFSRTLFTLLDTWSGSGDGLSSQLPDQRYFNEEEVLNKILRRGPVSLGYDEIVQLTAYAQFLRAHENGVDQAAFSEWMRVVFNLTTNTEYNRPDDVRRSMASLIELTPHMTSIIEFLADPDSTVTGFFGLQIAEEQTKARLLLANESWRSLIEKAEGHGYFRGQIGFILYLCGAETDQAEQRKQEWSESETTVLQNEFERFLHKAVAMFDDNGLKKLSNHRWERALLSLGDYLLPSGRNYSFLEPASWKRLLRDIATARTQSEVITQLWQKLNVQKPIAPQLDDLIESADGLEEWRQALVKTPAAIAYCSCRMVRRIEEDQIYLLTTMQLNGWHAELFTYCLHENLLNPAMKDKRFQVLRAKYVERRSVERPPGIQFTGEWHESQLDFFLRFDSDHYAIELQSSESIPDELSERLRAIGFAESEGQFGTSYPIKEIEKRIFELDNCLANGR